MSKREIVLCLVVCLSISVLVPVLCHAQRYRQATSRPDARQSQQLFEEQRRKEFEKRMAAENEVRMAEHRKEFERQAKDRLNGKDERRNESIKQALELTEEQWTVIEPKINRVYFFKNQAGINIEVSGGGAGGYVMGAGGSSGSSFAGSGTVSPGNGAGRTWKTQSSGGSAGGGFGGGAGSVAGGGASFSSGSASRAGTATSTAPHGTGQDSGWKVQKLGSGTGGIVTQGFSGPLWRLADRELTEGEKTCEELLKLLEDKNSKQQDIDQKIEALRRARENAAKELAKARQELREVLTARQQARLVLTGLLD